MVPDWLTTHTVSPMLQALIFDVDGTLSETEELHRRAFNHTFEAFALGWQWDRPTYRDLIRVPGGKERLTHYVRSNHPEIVRSGRLETLVGHTHAFKASVYAEMTQGGQAKLRPGVERLLREARDANIRLAIATTTSVSNVELLLKGTLGPEAIGWFEVICGGDVVENKKPAPDVYERVLREMTLRPDQCVAFEDSEPGLTAAVGAGLVTVVTPAEYTAHGNFERAALVVDNLGEPSIRASVLRGPKVPKGLVDLAFVAQLLKEAPAMDQPSTRAR